jgi:hypothetical protein
MSRMEQVKAFVADLARPFAIISTSFAASWGIVVVSYKVNDGNDGALYLGAALAGVGAIYIGKSVEVFKSNKAAADVEIAKHASTPPPGTAQITAAPDVDVTVREAGVDQPEDPAMFGGPRA